MNKNKKVLIICLVVLLALIIAGVAGWVALSGRGSNSDPNDVSAAIKPTEDELPLMSVKEVLETPDYTHVLFEGIVTGYDYGKRHMIIEDVDGSCAIQLYKNPGFAKAKVGDLVRVDGYRTYDKSLDRITPNTLEVISSGNPCTADNPVVLDSSKLAAWTNENRTNPGIMFKTYTFTNVEINEISGSYTYIDSKYDEKGGRGLKIGIKNDSSYVDVSELKLVQGEKYNITGIIYGVSDDFYDESRDGIVLRMSILSVDDVELIIENPEKSKILVSGQRSFLVEDAADKPDFTTYLTVYDPVDGVITVTEDMITESVDMTVAGTYPVKFTYTNSSGDVLKKTFNIYVSKNGLSVTKALSLVPEYIDLHVHGVVVGWTYNESQKTAMVIEDPKTGKAIEMWTNNKSDFQKLKVGDHVVVYSSALGYEKQLPRLSGQIKVVKVLETGVALTRPTVISDLSSWTAKLARTKANFFGRYTFTADFIKTKGNYAYFYNATKDTGNIIQVALYQSAVSYDFVPGYTYKVTAVAVGLSDSYSALSEKSIVMRMSIMNESDITLISTNAPPVLEEGNHGISVSEAIKLLDTNTAAYINGYVAGFVKNDDGNHTAVVLQDTATGECIEFWANDHSNYREIWNTYAVGDHVVIHTDKIVSNKGLPRAGETKQKTTPVMVGKSYKISSGNEIKAVEITDMEAFLQDAITNGTNILGKYSYTGIVNNKNGYLYVTEKGDGYKLRVDQYNSPVSATFENGKTYKVNFVVLAYSKALTEQDNVTLRIAIMKESDVTLVSDNAPPVLEEGNYGISVSEAIKLLDTNTAAYINGYVAGFVKNGDGNHTAIVLQDTVNGECIEFWANDHSNYRDIWNTYAVGDHVVIYTDKVVSNKGLPRAGGTKQMTTPVMVGSSYKISTGNEIKTVEIADMEAFLQNAITNGTNILGKYSYTGTVTNEDGYLYVTDKVDGYKLKVDLYNSPVSATFENGKKYNVTFVILAYSKALSTEEDITLRIAIMNAEDVETVVEIPEESTYVVECSGETELLAGTAKPDFTTYFTIVDSVDGTIAVTSEMLTDNVDMSTAGTYEVKLSTQNSKGAQISYTLEIKVINSLSVSEAIALKGTNTAAYINGYVAGWSVEGTRKAIVLQDTVTGECIEFWGSDSSAYNDVWATYHVGDHVTIHADSIVDNKGLPRANKAVTPIQINGSYIMSSDNTVKVTEITDMDAFLTSVYSDGKNTLGVYTCTATVADSNYFHRVTTTGGTLSIQLYQSVAIPAMEVGTKYTIKFVLTGYNKALSNTGNLYVRVSVMDTSDVVQYVEIPEDADFTVSTSGETELLAGTAKPDFTTYFTVVDSVDGTIAVTDEMLTDNVDMNTAGTYEVKLSTQNSEGKQISHTLEVKVINSLSVSEAIALKGTNTAAYINGYVAGWSVDGTRKAIILQDTASNTCIEFWGSDSSAYNDVWATYNVGDHVTVHADSIVDNKGLPRANKTVTPIQINGSYVMSSGNTIKVTEITDMDAFLTSAYNGTNTLGVYTYTGTVANADYFHNTKVSDSTKLRIQLKNSVATPTMEVGSTYTIKFVLTGYSKAMTETGNLYVRVSVMDAADVQAAE